MTNIRSSYQHGRRLLEQIRAQVAELYWLKVSARGALLDRKRQLADTRGRLAALVGGNAGEHWQKAA